MIVKYNNQKYNITNTENKKQNFYAIWNDYTIWIQKEYKDEYYCQVINPYGSYNVDGYFRGTLSQVLQECFDNIDIPLLDINNEPEDEEGDDTYN